MGSCDVMGYGILLGLIPELPVTYKCPFNILAKGVCRVALSK